MNEMIMNVNENGKITSLELVEQINFFRADIEGKSELKHYDLLKVIRDEFEEEIGEGEISLSSYTTRQNKQAIMYELTTSQAKQVLVRESKSVRKAVIRYIERLEEIISSSAQAPSAPTTYLEALEALVSVEREKQMLLETVEVNKPKVVFAEALEVSDRSCLVGEMAKILTQNGIKTGQNKLYEWLRENGYLIAQKGRSDYNLPTQRAMNAGLFEIKSSVVHLATGQVRETRTTVITVKGQIHLVNKLKKLNEEV